MPTRVAGDFVSVQELRRTHSEMTSEGQAIGDVRLFTDNLLEYEENYKNHQPRGALGGQRLYR